MATVPKLPDFDALWNYDDLAATEQQFRAIAPQAEQRGDRAYYAELLTQIARAEGLQRKFAEAHATLDAAQTLIAPGLVRPQIRYLLERGRVFNSSRQPARAKPLFLEAWDLARANQEDFFAIDAAHMIAIVEPAEQKLEWERRALAYAEASDQPRAKTWLGSLYNNMGWSYHALGDYTQALDLFQKALAAREAAGAPGPIRIARWCVARALRSLGRPAEAIQIQRALQAELARDHATDGYVDEELGECLLASGHDTEARPYFARAYAELSQDPWLAENEPARLERLKQLGIEGDRS